MAYVVTSIHGMVRYGTVPYGMVMVWYGMVWYGMVWYGYGMGTVWLWYGVVTVWVRYGYGTRYDCALLSGLQAYMNRHKYGNTETVDLWTAWSEVGRCISMLGVR